MGSTGAKIILNWNRVLKSDFCKTYRMPNATQASNILALDLSGPWLLFTTLNLFRQYERH